MYAIEPLYVGIIDGQTLGTIASDSSDLYK